MRLALEKCVSVLAYICRNFSMYLCILITRCAKKKIEIENSSETTLSSETGNKADILSFLCILITIQVYNMMPKLYHMLFYHLA